MKLTNTILAVKAESRFGIMEWRRNSLVSELGSISHRPAFAQFQPVSDLNLRNVVCILIRLAKNNLICATVTEGSMCEEHRSDHRVSGRTIRRSTAFSSYVVDIWVVNTIAECSKLVQKFWFFSISHVRREKPKSRFYYMHVAHKRNRYPMPLPLCLKDPLNRPGSKPPSPQDNEESI